MSNEQLLNNMVNSLTGKLNHKINDLGMNIDQAVEAVKSETCAGSKVWEIVLKQYEV